MILTHLFTHLNKMELARYLELKKKMQHKFLLLSRKPEGLFLDVKVKEQLHFLQNVFLYFGKLT